MLLPAAVAVKLMLKLGLQLIAMVSTLLLAASSRATLLWDGNATNGLGVFKLLNIDGTNGSSVTAVSDPIYGTVWQFYKAMDDTRCEAHGAAGVNPAIGQTYYICWRTKLAMPTTAALNAIFQWKAYGTPQLQDFPITIAPGGGTLALNQFNPSDAGGQTTLWTTPVVTNVWVSHMLAINVSTQDYGGYIEYWYNGVQQTFTTGTNQFYCRTFDGTSVDPKWGVYGGGTYTVIDYVSGLKIGTTYADVVDSSFLLTGAPVSQIAGITGTNLYYTVNVVTNPGYSGSVALSMSGLPANASASFSPPSVTGPGASTLSVTTSNTTPLGTYTLFVKGVDGTETNMTTVELVVNKAPRNLVWNGPGAGANNWSAAGNWSPAGPPEIQDSALFLNPGAVASISNIDNCVDAGFAGAVTAVQFGNTNNNHTTLIASGQTLNVTGENGLLVGTETDNGSSQTVFATVTGPGGTLAIMSDANSAVVVRQGTANSSGSQRATLEMSGLGVFTATAGRVLVGVVGPVPRATGTLYLAKTNTLILSGADPQICVGDNNGNGGGQNFLYLGQTNAVFAKSITIGREKATGSLAFNSRFTNSTAWFRGPDGVGPVSLWNIGDASAQSASADSTTGTNDFSLGRVDALVDTLSVGVGQTTTGANGSGVLTFSTGTFNINTLQIGVQSATNATSAGIGRVNVNSTNALLVVNSTLELGYTSGGGGTTNTYGLLNINGGTVLAQTIAAGAGSGTNAIAVNNGTLVVSNAIGATGTGIINVSLTNALLQFSAASGRVNLTATNLTTGPGVNTINIASLPATNSFPARFRLIQYAGAIAGAGYNFTLGTMPPGPLVYSGYLSNNLSAAAVDLVVTNCVVLRPVIGGLTLSGTNLVVLGTNGAPGWPCYVLASTNLTLPMANWTRVATNSFDAAGHLAFTNAVAAPEKFYRLQLP
jgi:hypothetical protein